MEDIFQLWLRINGINGINYTINRKECKQKEYAKRRSEYWESRWQYVALVPKLDSLGKATVYLTPGRLGGSSTSLSPNVSRAVGKEIERSGESFSIVLEHFERLDV